MTARNLVLYLGGTFVMIAVIGAIYLEILVQSRSTHDVWMVTQDVAAGQRFDAGNVRMVGIPDTGDRILYYRGNPIGDRRRAGHSLAAGHMIADDDLLRSEIVLVPVNFKAAPPLKHGDSIDVYTQIGSKTIQVGRGLAVESPTTIWVPAVDEPSWITLQANNAPLFAATSAGVGVPATAALGINDAVNALASAVAAPPGSTPPLVPATPPSILPSPTAVPPSAAPASPSPRPTR